MVRFVGEVFVRLTPVAGDGLVVSTTIAWSSEIELAAPGAAKVKVASLAAASRIVAAPAERAPVLA